MIAPQALRGGEFKASCFNLSFSSQASTRSFFSKRYNPECQAGLTSLGIAATMRMESELDMTWSIRNRVKELRIERGWTQAELADAVGVSRQSINSIERERYVPSLLLALTFARVFKCSTDEIFKLEKEK